MSTTVTNKTSADVEPSSGKYAGTQIHLIAAFRYGAECGQSGARELTKIDRFLELCAKDRCKKCAALANIQGGAA